MRFSYNSEVGHNADLLLRFRLLGSLESYNQRDLEFQLLRGVDDTLSNVIAPHDT